MKPRKCILKYDYEKKKRVAIHLPWKYEEVDRSLHHREPELDARPTTESILEASMSVCPVCMDFAGPAEQII